MNNTEEFLLKETKGFWDFGCAIFQWCFMTIFWKKGVLGLFLTQGWGKPCLKLAITMRTEKARNLGILFNL